MQFADKSGVTSNAPNLTIAVCWVPMNSILKVLVAELTFSTITLVSFVPNRPFQTLKEASYSRIIVEPNPSRKEMETEPVLGR